MGGQEKVVHMKCVIIGDSNAGKTELVRAFFEKEAAVGESSFLSKENSKKGKGNKYPPETKPSCKYTKTQFDNFKFDYPYNNKLYLISVFDTAGSEDFEKIRKLSYPQTDIFIICFSMNSTESFKSVYRKWLPEVESYNMPIIVLACKCDTVYDKINTGDQVLDPNITNELNKYTKNKPCKFLKCSAVEKTNIELVIKTMVQSKEQFDIDFEKMNRRREASFFKRISRYFCCASSIYEY